MWLAIVGTSAMVLVAGLVAAWYRLPAWLLRPLRGLRVADLGLNATGDDARLVEDWGRVVSRGIYMRLQRPLARWVERCDLASPRWRSQVVEGAAYACGVIHTARPVRRLELPCELLRVRPHWSHAACFGIGLWGGVRYGCRFEEFLRSVAAFEPWWRFVCMDGYGFKFGLIDHRHDPRGTAHLHAIPGYFRRAAFQGVGRALYFVYLSDRRGLIETIGEFAPQHDGDLIEGASFAAAYCQPDRPRRALDFVRAMPYEWRTGAHLGMTLGFRARAIADPAYFEQCVGALPRMHRETIQHAITLAGEMEEQIRHVHRTGAYGLWREKLAARLHRERLWEPAYIDAPEQSRSGGEGAVR